MIGTGNCWYGNRELMYAISVLFYYTVRCLENVNHLKNFITFSMSTRPSFVEYWNAFVFN